MIERRRYMVGKPKEGYIQDGLVFWLDGINKGTVANAWTDLVGGISFPFDNVVTVNTDSVTFATGSDIHTEAALPSHNNIQIEIVCTFNGYGQMVLMNSTGYIKAYANWYFWSSYISVVTCGKKFNYPFIINSKYSVSSNVQHLMVNGVDKITQIGMEGLAGANSNTYLGRRSNGNYYTGSIYNVRIYDRTLTDEEILHNYLIDKQRFNIQ